MQEQQVLEETATFQVSVSQFDASHKDGHADGIFVVTMFKIDNTENHLRVHQKVQSK